MNLVKYSSLQEFFGPHIKNIPICQDSTKAYITRVLSHYAWENDLSQHSLTLTYHQARQESKFELFQRVADWILFSKITFPTSLQNASEDYYNALAQNSYYTCYRLINRQWILYEELADLFPSLVAEIRSAISSKESFLFSSFF